MLYGFLGGSVEDYVLYFIILIFSMFLIIALKEECSIAKIVLASPIVKKSHKYGPNGELITYDLAIFSHIELIKIDNKIKSIKVRLLGFGIHIIFT